jgi:long-chain acyl-CoA synthetase
LLGGENVEPLPIESKLLESPLIDQCMVVGQDQKHLGVLVVPSLQGFAVAGIGASELKELQDNPAATALLRGEIQRLVCAQTGFKNFERIAAVMLLGRPFDVGEELTLTYKLRRHVIAERNDSIIRSMFS